MATSTVPTIIAPSLLSGDFAFLARDCNQMLEFGADYLHMAYRHFVPNITIGAPVIKSLRKHTKGFLDCHLMVESPEKWVDDFAEAGANGFTFHIEATRDAATLIQQIQKAGMKACIALKPDTPIAAILPYADKADMILVMTVNPGFGGQPFQPNQMDKVRLLRQRFPQLLIQVDGGLNLTTVHEAAKAGANVIVAGSAVFNHSSAEVAIRELREAVDKAKLSW